MRRVHCEHSPPFFVKRRPMRQLIASAVVCIVFASSARSQDVPAQLLNLMPKDQAEAAKKFAAVLKIRKDASAEKNALKKKELRAQAEADGKAIVDELNQKIQKDGL